LGDVLARHGAGALDAADVMALEQAGRCARTWVSAHRVWETVFERDYPTQHFECLRAERAWDWKRLWALNMRGKRTADSCNATHSGPHGLYSSLTTIDMTRLAAVPGSLKAALPAPAVHITMPEVALYVWCDWTVLLRVSLLLSGPLFEAIPFAAVLLAERIPTDAVVWTVPLVKLGDLRHMVILWRPAPGIVFVRPQ
jgi:hypothetical protein